MMAPFSAWANPSTASARRNGRSTGCSIRRIGFDVQVSEVTGEIAALAVQGPTSCAVLKAAGLAGVERLKPFEIGQCLLQDYRVTVSRTGFTGDLGYELWMEPGHADAVWDALMAAGRSRGIRAIGSQALNMARIEAGFLAPNRRLRIGRNTPFASAATARRWNWG